MQKLRVRLPRKLTIDGKDYQVRRAASAPLFVHLEETEWAKIHREKQVIVVSDKLKGAKLLETLIHEAIHAVLGREHWLSAEQEERVAEELDGPLASAVMQILGLEA